MATTKQTTVVGVFTDRRQADAAVDDLRRAGFRDDQIGMAARDDKGTSTTTKEKGTYVEEGAVAGAVAGAGVGGLIGLGVLAGVIPVIGPAIAAGTLGVILANAAGGAAIATVIGALVGMGIPEEEATYYEGEFKAGRILVTVHANGRADEARAILLRHGAYDRTTAATTTATATAGRATAGQTVQLHEEQLHAHKHPVQTGEVRVRKEVVSENKTLEVPVTREEVVVERHPVAGQRASSSDIRAGEEIRIPVKEEQVHVEKEAVVKEEVKVGKRQVQDTQQVSGTVRHEEAHVEQEGDVNVHGETGKKRNKK